MANSKGTTDRNKKPSNTKKNLKQPIPIDSATSSTQAQASSTSIHPDPNPGRQAHPGIEEEIRRRAYALYEERGRQEGFHDEDWARAESEVLSKHGDKEKSA